jgi:hypothetical protein
MIGVTKLSINACDAFAIRYPWSHIHHTLSDVIHGTSSPTITSRPSLSFLLSLVETTTTNATTSNIIAGSESVHGSDRKRNTTNNSRNDCNERTDIMVNIGYIYHQGIFEVGKDMSRAAEWYRRAARLDDPFGCFNIALLYRDV